MRYAECIMHTFSQGLDRKGWVPRHMPAFLIISRSCKVVESTYQSAMYILLIPVGSLNQRARDLRVHCKE